MPSSRSSSSGTSDIFRSSKSKDHKKEVSRSSNGTVIVHEYARGYDRAEPSPSYRNSGSTRR
ncbi:hypothetical protein PG997_010201 [Apiospora hydei]|uniref:Uncharacterized protein n=1 Tax=Apiospora hydei TaxID=1337664 RepID=A0ABR1VWB8_9PEZI